MLVSISMFSCRTIIPTYELLPFFTKDVQLDDTKNFPHQPTVRLQFALPSDTSSIIDVLVYKIAVTDDDNTYLASFSKSKMIFSGYTHEYARSTNRVINEIGRIAVEEYKKLEY